MPASTAPAREPGAGKEKVPADSLKGCFLQVNTPFKFLVHMVRAAIFALPNRAGNAGTDREEPVQRDDFTMGGFSSVG